MELFKEGEDTCKNIYNDNDFFKAYAGMERSQKGLAGAGEWHQLEPLFPKLADSTVLDLGCGYGWHCAYAVGQGAAKVVGIDASSRMIGEAEMRNADPRIFYQVCSLQDYAYPPEKYDLVISNLALHYVEDLEDIYRKVYRTLKPGGVFLFNIEHPVFTGSVGEEWVYDSQGKPLYWPVDGYFYPGERQTNFLGKTVAKQHHTLTQILMGLIRCGFGLEVVEEAMPSEKMRSLPGMEDEMRRPMMLLVRAGKAV